MTKARVHTHIYTHSLWRGGRGIGRMTWFPHIHFNFARRSCILEWHIIRVCIYVNIVSICLNSSPNQKTLTDTHTHTHRTNFKKNKIGFVFICRLCVDWNLPTTFRRNQIAEILEIKLISFWENSMLYQSIALWAIHFNQKYPKRWKIE